MKLHRSAGRWLIGAALISLPAAAFAQDNASVAGTTSEMNASTTTGTTDLNASTTTDMNGSMGTTTADPVFADDTLNTAEPYTEVREKDDDDFPWGLLGLLGLAGLLGRKRHDASDIHVDARHDNRP